MEENYSLAAKKQGNGKLFLKFELKATQEKPKFIKAMVKLIHANTFQGKGTNIPRGGL